MVGYGVSRSVGAVWPMLGAIWTIEHVESSEEKFL